MASIVSQLPFALAAGNTADASQVMANFNQIVADVNENAATGAAGSGLLNNANAKIVAGESFFVGSGAGTSVGGGGVVGLGYNAAFSVVDTGDVSFGSDVTSGGILVGALAGGDLPNNTNGGTIVGASALLNEVIGESFSGVNNTGFGVDVLGQTSGSYNLALNTGDLGKGFYNAVIGGDPQIFGLAHNNVFIGSAQLTPGIGSSSNNVFIGATINATEPDIDLLPPYVNIGDVFIVDTNKTITLGQYTLVTYINPGTAGQILSTDGSGNLSWVNH